MGSGVFAFSGPVGALWTASGFAGAVVALVCVECDFADDFAGGCVDDADVESVDEQNDGGSFEGSAESDFVHLSVETEGDSSVVDAVVTDPDFWFAVVGVGGCFGSQVVGGGGCRGVR